MFLDILKSNKITPELLPVITGGKMPYKIVGDFEKGVKSARVWDDVEYHTYVNALELNVGYALPADLLVIDIDHDFGNKNGHDQWEAICEELDLEISAEDTLVVETRSGGLHIYFRCEAGSDYFGKLAEHIDVKKEGGYVLIPPSVIDGNPYKLKSPASVVIGGLPAGLSNIMKRQDTGDVTQPPSATASIKPRPAKYHTGRKVQQ